MYTDQREYNRFLRTGGQRGVSQRVVAPSHPWLYLGGDMSEVIGAAAILVALVALVVLGRHWYARRCLRRNPDPFWGVVNRTLEVSSAGYVAVAESRLKWPVELVAAMREEFTISSWLVGGRRLDDDRHLRMAMIALRTAVRDDRQPPAWAAEALRAYHREFLADARSRVASSRRQLSNGSAETVLAT